MYAGLHERGRRWEHLPETGLSARLSSNMVNSGENLLIL